MRIGARALELRFTDVPDCEVRKGDIRAATETRFGLVGPAEEVEFVSGSGGTFRFTLLAGTYELVPESDSCAQPSRWRSSREELDALRGVARGVLIVGY